MIHLTKKFERRIISIEVAVSILILVVITFASIAVLSVRFGDGTYAFGLYLLFPNLLFLSTSILGWSVNLIFYLIMLGLGLLGLYAKRDSVQVCIIHFTLLLLMVIHLLLVKFTAEGLIALISV